jgi:hypothetical protein
VGLSQLLAQRQVYHARDVSADGQKQRLRTLLTEPHLLHRPKALSHPRAHPDTPFCSTQSIPAPADPRRGVARAALPLVVPIPPLLSDGQTWIRATAGASLAVPEAEPSQSSMVQQS